MNKGSKVRVLPWSSPRVAPRPRRTWLQRRDPGPRRCVPGPRPRVLASSRHGPPQPTVVGLRAVPPPSRRPTLGRSRRRGTGAWRSSATSPPAASWMRTRTPDREPAGNDSTEFRRAPGGVQFHEQAYHLPQEPDVPPGGASPVHGGRASGPVPTEDPPPPAQSPHAEVPPASPSPTT